MKLTPNYSVSYKGKFYKAGETFTFDKQYYDEMKEHGIVTYDETKQPTLEKDSKKQSAHKQSANKKSKSKNK